jgi:hypothetical protein
MAAVGRCPEDSLELYKRLTCQPLATDQAVWGCQCIGYASYEAAPSIPPQATWPEPITARWPHTAVLAVPSPSANESV